MSDSVPDYLPDLDSLPEAPPEVLDEKHQVGQQMRADGQLPLINMTLRLYTAYAVWEHLSNTTQANSDPSLRLFVDTLGGILAQWREYGFHPETGSREGM